MITLVGVSDKCWWCGSMADSKEHMYKKTDFKKIHGMPPYEKGDEPVVNRNGKLLIVQGPNSNLLKFDEVLCKKCNNERSQKFDFAYSNFIDWIETNTLKVIKTGEIDFKEVFGDDFFEKKQNLFRYYVKHFCCRLASSGIEITDNLIEFLNEKKVLEDFYIKFEIRIDILLFTIRNHRDGVNFQNLFKGNLFGEPYGEREGFKMFNSCYTYKWFKTYFYYSKELNNVNIFDYNEYNEAQVIEVESLYTVDPDFMLNSSDDELKSFYENLQSEN